MKEGLKILSAEVENFKNINHKVVEFEGRSAIILGKNGSGKSSLIQALTCAIDSNMIPSKAIKEGEETASALVKIGGVLGGEYQEYNIDMYFSEKDQKGKLVVSDKDGGKIPGGKSMVKSIVGNVGFDILEFINLGLTKDGKVSVPGVKEQIEVLLQFLPAEIQKKLMELDAEKKAVYDERTEINKDIKSNEAKLKDAQMDPEEIEKYSDKLDDTEVKKKMSEIGEAISNYDRIKNGVDSKREEKENADAYIESLELELKKKKADRDILSEEIAKGNGWLKKNERPSMELLSTELERINTHNETVKKVVEMKEFDKNVKDLTVKSEEKTSRYKQIDVDKLEIFKDNPLPVKGLTFSEDEILYNGLPFNENQHPSSTIIGVGLTVAMAMNPNLKLLIIRDGSLLDQKTLNYILKLIEKKGYQVFIEMVDQSGEKDVTVNFIESQGE